MDWKHFKRELGAYETEWWAGKLSDRAAAEDVLALMAHMLSLAVNDEDLTLDELADLTVAVIPLASLIDRKGAN